MEPKTIDALLKKYGALMHEAGVCKGELLVHLRFSASLKDLPDNPLFVDTPVHLGESAPSQQPEPEPMILARKSRIQHYEVHIIEIVNKQTEPMTIKDVHRLVMEAVPHLNLGVDQVNNCLVRLVQKGYLTKIKRGLYGPLKQHPLPSADTLKIVGVK